MFTTKLKADAAKFLQDIKLTIRVRNSEGQTKIVAKPHKKRMK